MVMRTVRKCEMLGMQLDAVDLDQAVARVIGWTRVPRSGCRLVVTPNVDHAVLLCAHPGLQRAYAAADLVLADGQPIVWASRLLGTPVPGRVPGSDLVPHLFSAIEAPRRMRVFLLGAGPGVAERAAHRIQSRWPQIETAGTCSPPPGFEHDDHENNRILEQVAAARPDVLLVGLGAPKQECWVQRHRHRIEASVALCVGATIDFLAGRKKRAPLWMQQYGLEWLHRMGSEPRRLVGRYARDAWIFPRLVMRQWIADRGRR